MNDLPTQLFIFPVWFYGMPSNLPLPYKAGISQWFSVAVLL
jgi:hypothetical protein